ARVRHVPLRERAPLRRGQLRQLFPRVRGVRARGPEARSCPAPDPQAPARCSSYVSARSRAGLVGNPSDGYHGRTISISVRNFWAEVVLYEWDSVDIVLLEDDRASF